ncbi:hypothetical protein R70006_06313 [Paraburkholderia domus]|uniref:hypothetical protein n=1 Tax=Paraburkholderia domus TaxID=2793075 RepID=UPI001911D3E7|nr:hypothetical protein [Paraburkholderia domus]MBK5052939.1 hypothetical protein [Burkholderia sp. R-70006]CAE6823335.1 hypothetical protein R70006_06313 [Paraburkholderia domus]
MKKVFLLTAGMIAAASVFAQPEATPRAELLSLRSFQEGDVQVSLPTVRHADGTICASYVSNASRDTAGKLDVQVSQICGKPVAGTNAFGAHVEYPQTLRALRTVTNGDLVFEVPDTGAEHAIPTSDKKCSLNGVTITGAADIRCTG